MASSQLIHELALFAAASARPLADVHGIYMDALRCGFRGIDEETVFHAISRARKRYNPRALTRSEEQAKRWRR